MAFLALRRAFSVCGLALLVYEALRYECKATSVLSGHVALLALCRGLRVRECCWQVYLTASSAVCPQYVKRDRHSWN